MDQVVDHIQARRVTFVAKGAQVDYEGQASAIELNEPVETIAVSRPIALAEATDDGESGRPEGALDIIWLPPTAGPSLDLERWLETHGSEGRPAIRASLRSTESSGPILAR